LCSTISLCSSPLFSHFVLNHTTTLVPSSPAFGRLELWFIHPDTVSFYSTRYCFLQRTPSPLVGHPLHPHPSPAINRQPCANRSPLAPPHPPVTGAERVTLVAVIRSFSIREVQCSRPKAEIQNGNTTPQECPKSCYTENIIRKHGCCSVCKAQVGLQGQLYAKDQDSAASPFTDRLVFVHLHAFFSRQQHQRQPLPPNNHCFFFPFLLFMCHEPNAIRNYRMLHLPVKAKKVR